MEKLKGRALFVFFCISVYLGCKSNETANSVLPPWKCDPFSQVFWGKNVKYFTTNNPGDTTFFDIHGNMVREVLGGIPKRLWAYDDNHNLIHEWRIDEREIQNNLYFYHPIDSTAVVQKCLSLPTHNWNYKTSDLSMSKYSFKVYILEQGGQVVKEINSSDNSHVFYSYDGTLLASEEYLSCGHHEVRFRYSYVNKKLKKLSVYQGDEQRLSSTDYFDSGLLDSTQYIKPDGAVRTNVYRYVFY